MAGHVYRPQRAPAQFPLQEGIRGICSCFLGGADDATTLSIAQNCPSLTVRGPAVKDRFLIMGRLVGETRWQYGAALESAEDAAEKRMSVERLRGMRGQLNEWGVF